MVKHLPAMRETQVQSLGWEESLDEEMATHLIPEPSLPPASPLRTGVKWCTWAPSVVVKDIVQGSNANWILFPQRNHATTMGEVSYS